MSEPKKITLQIDGEEMAVCMPEKIMSDGGPSDWKHLYYRPLPEPQPSLEEEVKQEMGIWHPSEEGLIVALCRVVERRLLALKKGEV